MEEIKKKQSVSISEVKAILQEQDPESMDQIQRWTYDMLQNFQRWNQKSQKK